MNKKLQQKIKFLISIYGLDTSGKMEGVFGHRHHDRKNTSCGICKFYSMDSLCVLKPSERTNYLWKDPFGWTWCIAWLYPKNRKT